MVALGWIALAAGLADGSGIAHVSVGVGIVEIGITGARVEKAQSGLKVRFGFRSGLRVELAPTLRGDGIDDYCA
jgi:hypothetical protein